MKTSARKAKRRRGKDMWKIFGEISSMAQSFADEVGRLQLMLRSESDRADRAMDELLEIKKRTVMECSMEERSGPAGPIYRLSFDYDAEYLQRRRNVDIEKLNSVLRFHFKRAAEAAIEEAGRPELLRRST